MTDEDRALLVAARLEGRVKEYTHRGTTVWTVQHDVEEYFAVSLDEVLLILRTPEPVNGYTNLPVLTDAQVRVFAHYEL